MKKRKQLSLIRLFKIANEYIINLQTKESSKNTKMKMEIIGEYLKYVNLHKYDDLS